MIILPVTLNGQHGFNFILDTGTRTPLVLNKKAILPLGLPRGRNISFSGAGLRGEVRGYAVNDVKIELPGIEAAGISMVVYAGETLYIKHPLIPVEEPANPLMARENVPERSVLPDDKDCYSNWKWKPIKA